MNKIYTLKFTNSYSFYFFNPYVNIISFFCTMSCPFCHNQSSTLTTSAMYCLPHPGLHAQGSTGIHFERTSHQPSTETILALRRQAGSKGKVCPRCGRTIPGPDAGHGGASFGAQYGSGKDAYPIERPLGYQFYHAKIYPGQQPVSTLIAQSQSRSSCKPSSKCGQARGNNVGAALKHLNQASRLLKC
ncbi:hypothetical protein TRFO_07626 [Tritrichomonas foetus]|uniref:Uncharacterized protein n=1 Tax=Tritrichomonas foetus TaxID=1144522 RepID=A0A1J4JV18_9EUKA|nr:hypothetical protein [Tritrichomonas foetus]OHT01374.1 hypothetical protein TRFO_07626 [Tritrichomonas foetus]|eukprot:OHT01374.1 hypothetical protein TRFO_07626 [Tritrichomonas foetus]